MADLANSDFVLGVDGGGTKTVAWLADGRARKGETILGKGLGGAGNPRAVGFEQALSNLDAAVAAAFGEAGLTRSTVAAACLALAGSDRDADRARIRAWADQRRLAHQLEVVNDAEPILSAGTPHGCGVALIAGTGSLAYGRNERGDTARVGGWGYLMGDEGSGYALAVAGLRAAMRTADGRGPATLLLDRFQQRLGANRPQQLVEVIYAPDMDRRRLAQLAPLVLETAEAGDPVAIHLVDAAARDLCEMVDVLCTRLPWEPRTLPLALAGSLLLGSRLLREQFLNHLRSTRPGSARATGPGTRSRSRSSSLPYAGCPLHQIVERNSFRLGNAAYKSESGSVPDYTYSDSCTQSPMA